MFLLQLEISLLSVPCLRQVSHLQWTLPKEVSVAVFFLSEELTAYFQGQSKGHHCRFWAAWSHQALKKVRKRLGQASKRWRFGPSLAAWLWLPWRLTHLELLTGISLKWRLISSVRERKRFLNTDKGSCISAKENSLKIPNRTCWLFFYGQGTREGKNAFASLEADCQVLCISDDFTCWESLNARGAPPAVGALLPSGPPFCLRAWVDALLAPSCPHGGCPWFPT